MATSGKSKSSSFPNGKRRVNDERDRLAPRAVRQQTDKHLMEECDDALVRRISGIPSDVQTGSGSDW